MAFIEVVRPNGTCYVTKDKIGSAAEKNYFRVTTERWGKIFFISEENYRRWCVTGRKQNEISGWFTSATYYFDNSLEGNDDLMIVEAYQADDGSGTKPPAAVGNS